MHAELRTLICGSRTSVAICPNICCRRGTGQHERGRIRIWGGAWNRVWACGGGLVGATYCREYGKTYTQVFGSHFVMQVRDDYPRVCDAVCGLCGCGVLYCARQSGSLVVEPLSVNTLRAAGRGRALLGLKENGDSSGPWATRFGETKTYAVGFLSPVDTCRSHLSRIQKRLSRAVREGRTEEGLRWWWRRELAARDHHAC